MEVKFGPIAATVTSVQTPQCEANPEGAAVTQTGGDECKKDCQDCACESKTTAEGEVLEVVQHVPEAARSVAPVPLPPPTSNAVAPLSSGGQLGDFIPDFTDMKLPRLNLAQNIGELQEAYVPGTLVLDRDLALWTPPVLVKGVITTPASPPVQIVFLGFRPVRYVEKTSGGARGRVAATPAAVVALGGTTEYSEAEARGIPLFQPLAEVLTAIRKPDHVEDDAGAKFPFDVDEGGGVVAKYCLALFAMKGTSYTSAAKYLFTQRRIGCLRGGYPSRGFFFTTVEKSFGSSGHAAHIPVLVPQTPSSESFLAWVKDILNS